METSYKTYEEKAQSILSKCMYMVVGTSTKDGKPWVAPVLYVYDDNYDFYFLSAIDAVHSENITKNPLVPVAIFDSNQKIGVTEGLQLEGKAEFVGEDEIVKAINLYCQKVFPGSTLPPTKRYKPEEYLGASEFRFFKVTLSEAYVTGEDRRVKINLKKE